MSVQKIIKEISKQIFYKDIDRLKKMKSNLIEENRKLGGEPHGFLFAGEFYTDFPQGVNRAGKREALQAELHETMQDYLFDIKKVQMDQLKVEQGLSMILIGCSNWQDVRDALPDSLAEMINETKNLPRTRQEAFNIINNERAKRQFAKIRPLIDIYLMSRLMM